MSRRRRALRLTVRAGVWITRRLLLCAVWLVFAALSVAYTLTPRSWWRW